MLDKRLTESCADSMIASSVAVRRVTTTTVITTMVILALVCAMAISILLQQRIAVTWDGVYYIDGARKILEGHGYVTSLGNHLPNSSNEMTHFPPMTSVLLAAGALVLRADVLTVAPYLYGVLFGLSAALIGTVIYTQTDSLRLSVWATLLFALSMPVLSVYTRALSEPPFLLFTLGALLFLHVFLERGGPHWLALIAIFGSLALLTRYTGIVMLCAIGLTLAFRGTDAWSSRLKNLAIFVLFNVLIVAPWGLRNLLVGDSPTSRTVSWHPPNLAEMQALATNILEWLLPHRVILLLPTVVQTLLLAAALVFVIHLCFRFRFLSMRGNRYSLSSTVIVFWVIYLPFLFMAKTFFDPDIDFNTRQLLPLFVATLILLCLLVNELALGNAVQWRIGLSILGLSFLSFHAISSRTIFFSLLDGNFGYASQRWSDSETLTFARQAAPDTLIFTNFELLVELHMERDALRMPQQRLGVNKDIWENPNYNDEMKEMKTMLAENNGMLLIFYAAPDSQRYASLDQLQTQLTYDLHYRFEDGAAFLSTP